MNRVAVVCVYFVHINLNEMGHFVLRYRYSVPLTTLLDTEQQQISAAKTFPLYCVSSDGLIS